MHFNYWMLYYFTNHNYCDLQLSLETGSFTAQFDRWNAQVTKGKFKCCQAEMGMFSWEI
jgi:hypothetical protein